MLSLLLCQNFFYNFQFLLLVYRKTTKFCIMHFYASDSLNSSGFKVFHVFPHNLPYRKIMFPLNKGSLLSFTYPNLLFLTSRKMSSGDVENKHTCLVADIREKALNLLPLSLMLAVGLFINALYHIEEISFFS